MIKKVIDAINRFSLIESGDTVTVALSGGADSVALLHLLFSLKEKLDITIKAAHLNHSIRGDEADRDEQFVKELCEKMGVELYCERIDIPKIAKQTKQSIELCARQERYAFFERVAADKVATAHTATDNAETLILNLARGSGIKGLCGIPPKRDVYIRPLIFCTRDDIESYCENNGLSFVTDSTNLEDDYTRNKIRHNVLPVLKEINLSFEDAIIRTTLSLSEDNAALDTMAFELLFKCECEKGFITEYLAAAPKSVAKRAIVKYFTSLYKNITLDNYHINSLYDIALNGGKTSLPKKLYGISKDGIFSIIDCEPENTAEFCVSLSKMPNVNNLFSNDTLDCDKIIGSPKVRTRMEGDAIRLKNRGCTKSLNKLFTENKIPTVIRDKVPVIADDKGVIWVYGVGMADRVSPTSKSKNLLVIETKVFE